jgi:hypothetical protein
MHKGEPRGPQRPSAAQRQEAALDPAAAPPAHVVGIDVAAATLAVVILPAAGAPAPAQAVANAAAGWRGLARHLRAAGCRPAATLLVL